MCQYRVTCLTSESNMAGQYKTRRNPDTGRIEKIPEEERAAMIEADEEQAARDKLFLASAEPEPEEAEEADIAIPGGAIGKAPDLPPKEEAAKEAAASAARGAATGSMFGPMGVAAGAAIGVGAAAVRSEMKKHQYAGSLEVGQGTTENRDLNELLAVTKQIARIGTPIKNTIITQPAGSRM